MANKYLLLSATLAGVAAGSVGTATLTAKAGLPSERMAAGEIVANQAAMAGQTLTQLATAGCAAVNTELELTGADVCTLAKVRQIHVYRDDASLAAGQMKLVVNAAIPGTWVPGEAE